MSHIPRNPSPSPPLSEVLADLGESLGQIAAHIEREPAPGQEKLGELLLRDVYEALHAHFQTRAGRRTVPSAKRIRFEKFGALRRAQQWINETQELALCLDLASRVGVVVHADRHEEARPLLERIQSLRALPQVEIQDDVIDGLAHYLGAGSKRKEPPLILAAIETELSRTGYELPQEKRAIKQNRYRTNRHDAIKQQIRRRGLTEKLARDK